MLAITHIEAAYGSPHGICVIEILPDSGWKIIHELDPTTNQIATKTFLNGEQKGAFVS